MSSVAQLMTSHSLASLGSNGLGTNLYIERMTVELLRIEGSNAIAFSK